MLFTEVHYVSIRKRINTTRPGVILQIFFFHMVHIVILFILWSLSIKFSYEVLSTTTDNGIKKNYHIHQESTLAVKLWTPDDDIRLNATITQTGTFCVSFHTYLKNSSFCAYCAFLLEGCRHYEHNFLFGLWKNLSSV